MNKIMRRSLAFIGPFILIYLMIGYANLNFNPMSWTDAVRFIHIYQSMIAGTLLLAAYWSD